MKIRQIIEQILLILILILPFTSPAFALVDTTVCTVQDQGTDEHDPFSFVSAVWGFNRTSNRECEEEIKFQSGQTFNIPINGTIAFTNDNDGDFNGDGHNLIVDGAGATVTFDATGLSPDTCAFQIKNSKSLWKNMTVKVHKAEKAFCDQGANNDFSGVTIVSDAPPPCVDTDGDGICDDGDGDGVVGDHPCTGGQTTNCDDNCKMVSNKDQADKDKDGVGDACDNCPDVANPDQLDSNHNKVGNACEPPPCDDADGDGICDDGDGDGVVGDHPCTGGQTTNCDDNCKLVSNKDQADKDKDGVGDACDNCPNDPNPDQKDSDMNGIGDVCDKVPPVDTDGDGIPDDKDNCPNVPNVNAQATDCNGDGDTTDPGEAKGEQCDIDQDGVGDACDDDMDGDGLSNEEEMKLGTDPKNPDTDGDGFIDGADKCPLQAAPGTKDGCPVVDTDGDGVPDSEDQCPNQAGPADNHGCPTTTTDTDGDGVPDSQDACPNLAGPVTNNGCPTSNPATTSPNGENLNCGRSGKCPPGMGSGCSLTKESTTMPAAGYAWMGISFVAFNLLLCRKRD